MWRFEDPSWLTLLWLLPVLPLLVGMSRAGLSATRRLACLAVRLAIAAALVLALARPSYETNVEWSPDPAVLPLLDGSASVGLSGSALQKKLLDYTETLTTDLISEPAVFAARCLPLNSADEQDPSQTDIEEALDWAARRLGNNPNGHVLLFTDGRATHGRSLSGAARAAANRLRVHTIPIGVRRDAPPRIVGVTPPDDARVGTTTHALVHVRSNESREIVLVALDNEGFEAARQTARIAGDALVGLPLAPQRKGLHAWTVTLADARRTTETFDLADLGFDVVGPPVVLLTDPEPLSLEPLQSVLRRLGHDYVIALPAEFPVEQSALSAYDLVVLSDWPAPSLGGDQIDLLDDFIRRGGGLIFVGGSSVGTRSWHGSPLEKLLPVEFDRSPVREKQKLKPVHVCFVIDSSGSMGQSLGVGATGSVSKFAMTKAAVAASLDALPESALVTLIAFDAVFHVVFEAVPIDQRADILARLGQLGVGGGTNILPPMIEALQILNRTDMPKHMIVLTDGISSEDPPNELLDWVRSSKISLTAVAVGADANTDLMQHIAKRTLGVYYFCDDAERIPRVFISEAEHITTLAQLDQPPLQPRLGPRPELLADLAADGWPQMEAAVPAKAKFAPTVEVSLVDDKYRPLLARWSYGLGAAAAFMSDAKPLWARRWMEWPDFERFWARVFTSLLPTSSPLGALTDVRIEDEQCIVLLSVYDEEGRLPSNAIPSGRLTPERPKRSDSQPLHWRRVSDTVFEGRAALRPGERYIGLIEVKTDSGEVLVQRRFMVSGRRETELLETGPDENTLRALAAAGNGRFNPSPAQLMQLVENRRTVELTSVSPYWSWLVALALALWPVDLALRRFGVKST